MYCSWKSWCLAAAYIAILLSSSIAHGSTVAIVGFEAGATPCLCNVAYGNGTIWGPNQSPVGTNYGIVNTVVHGGGYAWRQQWALNQGEHIYIYPNATSTQALSSSYLSFYFYTTVTGSTGNNLNSVPLAQFQTSAGAAITSIYFNLTSTGGTNIGLYNNVAAHQIGGNVPITTGVWHLLELATTIASSGATVEMRLDGGVSATSSVENTGGTLIGSVGIWQQGNGSPVSATGDSYWDDIVWNTSAYDGIHKVISRSSAGQTSTPTYNSFTLTGG